MIVALLTVFDDELDVGFDRVRVELLAQSDGSAFAVE
jgi:hypothetical protein